MNFIISLIISVLFILVPAYYSFQNDKDKKHHKTVFIFSLVGLLLVIINAIISNYDSKNNEKIAQKNDSLYKVQLNKNLANSEKIIKSLSAQLKSSQILLSGSDKIITKQNESSVMLAKQLKETDKLLGDNKVSLSNTSLALKQFERINSKIEDVFVEIHLEYSLIKNHPKRDAIQRGIKYLNSYINNISKIDSLQVADFYIDHEAKGNRVRMARWNWDFKNNGFPQYNGYQVYTYVYKNLIIEKLKKDNDSLLYCFTQRDYPSFNVTKEYSKFRRPLLEIYPYILVTDKLTEPKGSSNWYINNLRFEPDTTGRDTRTPVVSSFQGYDLITNVGHGIYKIRMKKTNSDNSIIGMVDLKGKYIELGFFPEFTAFESSTLFTGDLRVQCSIKSFKIYYGENFLQKLEIPAKSLVANKNNKFIYKF